MAADLDQLVANWRDAGPVSNESMKLLIDLQEARLTEQPKDLLWAAFVRSLSEDQKAALLELIEAVGRDEIYRMF